MRTVAYDTDSAHDTSSRFHDMKDRVNVALDAAKHRMMVANADVKSAARNAANVTDRYVHDQPWQAIGLGLLLGLALGAAAGLFRRRY